MNGNTLSAAGVIARAQLPHTEHAALIRTALSEAPEAFVVLGSAFRSRDSRNPFTWEEREQMIRSFLSSDEQARMTFLPVRDVYDTRRWAADVERAVTRRYGRNAAIGLVGHRKEDTSGYLNEFPSWKSMHFERRKAIDATALRSIYFSDDWDKAGAGIVSLNVEPSVMEWLCAWRKLPSYEYLVRETQAIVDYRKRWTEKWHMAADAVVTIDDHVLMVQRRGPIGTDLWAVPGGFVELDDTSFFMAALRELVEETQFDALPGRMRSCLVGRDVFEHPNRSPRGRIVSNAFHFKLPGTAANLPEVAAGSDAKAVRFIHKLELAQMGEQLFEDHDCILDRFEGIFGGTPSSQDGLSN